MNKNFTLSLKKLRLFPEKSEESVALLNGNLHCSVLLLCLNLGFVRYLERRK